ncbi:hypothetical protein F0U61_04750 [Archangium violaceum]|uniref:hypothetical protein n=1 Tax=Archangium violaceum TaxID=83451 RepID=UPI002B3050C2|nr:hypothetical protein F0U61_04750 [Archangium violaceum]
MATLKTLLTFILAGAFLGLATASWLAPKWLEWDNTTRFQSTQTMCDLPQVIRQISADLLHYQLIGTLVGAGAFFLLGIFFVVARSKKQKQSQQPPPTPPQPRPAA